MKSDFAYGPEVSTCLSQHQGAYAYKMQPTSSLPPGGAMGSPRGEIVSALSALCSIRCKGKSGLYKMHRTRQTVGGAANGIKTGVI